METPDMNEVVAERRALKEAIPNLQLIIKEQGKLFHSFAENLPARLSVFHTSPESLERSGDRVHAFPLFRMMAVEDVLKVHQELKDKMDRLEELDQIIG